MLKRQSLVTTHKRTDGVNKWSDGRFKMRAGEKGSFPTERIIKLNSLWKDTREPKRVNKLKMDWMDSRRTGLIKGHQHCSDRSSGQELPKPRAVGGCASDNWFFLTLLSKPLVLAVVRSQTVIVCAKIQPNHRDDKFYKQQYRYTLLPLYTEVWERTLNCTQLGIQRYIPPEKAAYRNQEIKR